MKIIDSQCVSDGVYESKVDRELKTPQSVSTEFILSTGYSSYCEIVRMHTLLIASSSYRILTQLFCIQDLLDRT